MNRKLIAVIMAVAKATVGFTVMAVDDVDAADGTKQVYVQVGKTDSTIALGINEGNYTQYEYKLTWTMQIRDQESSQVIATIENGTGTLNTFYVSPTTIESNVPSDYNFTISLKQDSNTGVYIVNITGKAQTTDAISFTLEPKIVLTIDSVEKTIAYEPYTIEVKVAESNEGKFQVEIEYEKMAVGQYFEGAIEPPTGLDIKNYDWYAVGLPDGLTMSSNGTVSGIPTEEGSGTFMVFATDSTGAVLYDESVDYEVGPRVVSGPTTFNYKVGTEGNLAYNPGKTYVFEANDKIILSVTNVGEEGEGTPIDSDVEVSLILTGADGTAEVTTLGDDDNIRGEFILRDNNNDENNDENNNNESGSFIVTISYGDETEQFRIYIVGQAAVIGPEIFIIGS